MAVRRFLAVLVAVALIAVAVLLRNGIDNDSGGGNGDAKIQVVCTPELADICRGLGPDIEVLVSEPGPTLEGLVSAGTSVGIAGWLAPGRWAEMMEGDRKSAGRPPLLRIGPPLARSPASLAIWQDRFVVLTRSCQNNITWKCVGEVAGKGEWKNVGGPTEWGAVKIGIPDPVNNATGLAALGAATVGYFGKAPTDLSSADLDDPGFRSWVRGLKAAQPNNPQLANMLTVGPAAAAGAATFKAVGERLIDAAARKPALTYPAPVSFADVVLATTDTDKGRRLVELVTTKRLNDANWDSPRAPGAALPPADLLDALRTVWSEA